MSSIPGYTLEAFLAWQYNLVVENATEANFSRAVAESMGVAISRPVITQTQFAPLVAVYEPYREVIERRLGEFDEDRQSWRGYAEYVDLDVPLETVDVASLYVKTLTATPATLPAPLIYHRGQYRKLSKKEVDELLSLRTRPANALSPADLEAFIDRVMFDVLLSPAGKPSTTVCRIYLTDTFSVMGHSNVLDHDNYNAKLGNHFAYLDAFDKLWDYVAVIKHFQK